MVTVKIHFANILKNGFEGGREPLEIRFRDKDAEEGMDGSLEGFGKHATSLGSFTTALCVKAKPMRDSGLVIDGVRAFSIGLIDGFTKTLIAQAIFGICSHLANCLHLHHAYLFRD